MEYPPICLSCKHFEEKDKCPFYEQIPFVIKNREKRCKYYDGNESNYTLYGSFYKSKGD